MQYVYSCLIKLIFNGDHYGKRSDNTGLEAPFGDLRNGNAHSHTTLLVVLRIQLVAGNREG